jgi:hypothetical protein
MVVDPKIRLLSAAWLITKDSQLSNKNISLITLSMTFRISIRSEPETDYELDWALLGGLMIDNSCTLGRVQSDYWNLALTVENQSGKAQMLGHCASRSCGMQLRRCALEQLAAVVLRVEWPRCYDSSCDDGSSKLFSA